MNIYTNLIFQFTTSRGGRHSQRIFLAFLLSFQFTTSRGGRPLPGWNLTLELVFQFTTSRGGRLRLLQLTDLTDNLSIHDLTRRSTLLRDNCGFTNPLSIHDLTRRSTSNLRNTGNTVSSFNSRPHEEVDLSVSSDHPQCPHLSIHDLTRRSTSAV